MTGYVVGRIQTEPKVPGSNNFVQLITTIIGRCLLLFKVRGQGVIVSLKNPYKQE